MNKHQLRHIKKLTAEMTMEAAIIVPIIMMVIVSIMYFSLYIHDVVTIKSYGYGIGIENSQENNEQFKKSIANKGNKMPTFIVNKMIEGYGYNGYFNVKVNIKESVPIKWMKPILTLRKSNKNIKIEKDISKELMYASRAICDELEDKKE